MKLTEIIIYTLWQIMSIDLIMFNFNLANLLKPIKRN